MTNAQEPAFPIVLEPDQTADIGLTKREYFALHLMAGVLSSPSGLQAAMIFAEKYDVSPTKALTVTALERADALLEALEGKLF